jgi:hypothetical protein
MLSRASCSDGSINCPTIATQGPTRDTASKMPPSVPLASFSPNHRRCEITSTISNTPRGTIMPVPYLGWRRVPVTIRYATCSIPSCRCSLIRKSYWIATSTTLPCEAARMPWRCMGARALRSLAKQAHNSLTTALSLIHHRLSAENVSEVTQAGRGR